MSTDASIVRRWRRRAAAATALVALAMSLVPVAAPAATVGSYQDHFTAGTYSGDDGSLSWATDWIEVGESDGPGGGSAEVNNEPHCPMGRCLILGRGGVDNVDAGVWRQADLSGADAVTLEFWYERHRHFSGQGFVRLSVSPDGATWHDLADYPLDVDDGSAQYESIDITSWATTTSQIRFELFNSSSDDSHMNIDWVQIWLDVTNSAPVLGPVGDKTANEGALLAFTATANDLDVGDTLTYTLAGTVPAGAAINPTTAPSRGPRAKPNMAPTPSTSSSPTTAPPPSPTAKPSPSRSPKPTPRPPSTPSATRPSTRAPPSPSPPPPPTPTCPPTSSASRSPEHRLEPPSTPSPGPSPGPPTKPKTVPTPSTSWSPTTAPPR